MKSWILLIVLAVALTAAATVAVPFLSGDSATIEPGIPAPAEVSDGPAPKVEVEGDTTHHFGVMPQENKGSHGWVFRNKGAGVLELRNLGTDCKCTVARLGDPKKPGADGEAPSMLAIPPGGSEVIEVNWNTRQVDGHYRQSARIGTNDPTRPEVTLAVEGQVYPAVMLDPAGSTVDFAMVSNDEDARREVAIYSKDRPGMKLTGLRSSNPALLAVESRPLTAEEAARGKVGAGHMVMMTLKMGPNLGSFAEEVLAETDHPDKPKIRLNVKGRVTGPITSSPDRVVIRGVTSSEGGSKNLILFAKGQATVKFEVVKKPEGIEVEIVPLTMPAGSKGSKYRMTVKVVPGAPAGAILDDVVLKTDHPKAAELRVPIDAIVEAPN